MGKKNRRGRRTTADTTSAENQNDEEAPTLGLKHIVFTHGGPQDAAIFEEYLEVLSSHVGIQPWHQLSEIAKAMIELQAPVHPEPTKPVRKYYIAQASTVTTEKVQTTDKFTGSSTTPNEPVVDDYEHSAT